MAAGMGSRYGGSKQTDSFGKNGEFIVDYSIYDAKNAGFDKVIFIIKEENYKVFHESVGSRVKGVKVEYAFQDLHDVPDGFTVPTGREKPWGTGHAVYAARKLLKDNFAVINADDFYGCESYSLLYGQLKNAKAGEWCMAGYYLENTVTEHGTVSRGVCLTDGEGYLTDVTERTKIGRTDDGKIAYFDDGTPCELSPDTTVSMNCWGFTPDFVPVLADGFAAFLAEKHDNPLKCEYYLPTAVKEAMNKNLCRVKVLKTPGKWFGVTYKEDKAAVVNAIAQLTAVGKYPENLWK